MAYWSALAEALQTARSHHIETATALDVLADSSGAIGVAKMKVPAIQDKLLNDNAGDTSFSLESAVKDIELMVSEIPQNDQMQSVIATVLCHYKFAVSNCNAGLDCSLVAAMSDLQKQ